MKSVIVCIVGGIGMYTQKQRYGKIADMLLGKARLKSAVTM